MIGQQTLMAQADAKVGAGVKVYTDGWDGYPGARRRLLDFLGRARPANPVVISGDIHSFWVNDLKPDFDDPQSPVVASEFVCGSITSQPPPEDMIQAEKSEGAGFIRFATGAHRGYARIEVTPGRWVTDLRALADVRRRDSACSTLCSWVVEDGKPGPRPA